MKGKWILSGSLLAVVLLALAGGAIQAQGPQPQGDVSALALMGTAFTYQGQLKKDGSPLNGNCDFQFGLWNAATGGTQIGTTQTKTNVPVSNGLFTISDLDFGSGAFNGDARWLAIAVRFPAGSGGYTSLSPRQALTPAPYAQALPGLWTQQNETSPSLIGGYHGNSVTLGAVGATIGGGGNSTYINSVTNNYGTVSGGVGNTASGNFATVGGGRSNTTSGQEATVGGGKENTASGELATIGGGYSNTASGTEATVGGGRYNQAAGTLATISGGDGNNAGNLYATVGGGYSNTVTGVGATVSGGERNAASNLAATVSGGEFNTASGYAATVSGGAYNLTDGQRATVGGGQGNRASGEGATVPGGQYAWAMHYGQMAYASGCFAQTGDAQASLYVMRNTSTGSDWTNLYLNGSSHLLSIWSGRTMRFDILIVGRSNGGESAGYWVYGVIENHVGTTAFVGTPVKLVVGEDDAAWDAQVLADDAGDILRVQVKGNGETIRWVATVRTAEVSW